MPLIWMNQSNLDDRYARRAAHNEFDGNQTIDDFALVIETGLVSYRITPSSAPDLGDLVIEGDNGTETFVQSIRFSSLGNIQVGTGEEVDNEGDNGMLGIPYCNGEPSGFPVFSPALVYDISSHKLWIYYDGVWRASAAFEAPA